MADKEQKIPREITVERLALPVLRGLAKKCGCSKLARAADTEYGIGHVYVQLPNGRLEMDVFHEDAHYQIWYALYKDTLYWALGERAESE